MMRIYTILFLLIPLFSMGQSSIDIGDGASIRMSGSAKIIILSGNPDTFVDNGDPTGGIIMESEDCEVIWKDVNTTGTYMVPFQSSDGTRIPFTYEITTAGTGGDIHFSSYETDVDNLPIPQSSPIFDEYGFNNSTHMVDRWWIIDPVDYTSKPEGSYTFTYADQDWNDPSNFITEVNLTTQRYNDIENRWLDWLYGPTANISTNEITILIANPLDQFPVWTLVDISDPLPIELIRLRVDCEELTVSWTTATETNSDYVIIQGSDDTFDWEDIIEVQSAGNSNQYLNYSSKAPPHNYYRLNQIDIDGSNEYSDVIYGCPDFESGEVMLYPTVNDGRFFLSHNSTYQIDIFDMMGKCVFSEKTTQTYFDMYNLSSGKYILRMGNSMDFKTFKFIITRY